MGNLGSVSDETDAPRPTAPSPAALAKLAPTRPAVTPSPEIQAVTDDHSASAAFGRVDEEGRVFVRDGDEEREVGSYPGASPEEALQYFARKYDELFADGVYDISIIFGGDYNEERFDLETAKWTVEYLLEQGWENDSVSTFEELRHDSPPFTMALTVEGQPVEARVHIVHAQMDNDAGAEQQLLRDLVTNAVKSHDVIIYSGHAGANAGFILDYEPRYELSDDEFDELEMSNKYQIYVFDGCNSYRTYVDKLMLNPARTFENTTAITTVNTTPFSAGYEVINRFVHWLTLTDTSGTHFPVSWNTLLQGVNDQHPDVYYGVHGVDQDPKLNPHGGAELVCQSCASDADCGAGGNLCINYEGGAACGVACTDSFACGDGYECITLEDDPELFYVPKQCVRTSLSCE